MDKLFNFEDETLNKGFQIDMGKISPEQREHVLRIFEARKIKWMGGQNATDRVGALWGGYNSLVFSGVLTQQETKYCFQPLIDYPTLCRASVQLEPKEFCDVAPSNLRTCIIGYVNEVLGYAITVTEMEMNRGGDHLYFNGEKVEARTGWCHGCSELDPNHFFDRLRGIYPVFKQSLTTETALTPYGRFVQELQQENAKLKAQLAAKNEQLNNQ